jgi:hypothetical protein
MLCRKIIFNCYGYALELNWELEKRKFVEFYFLVD